MNQFEQIDFAALHEFLIKSSEDSGLYRQAPRGWSSSDVLYHISRYGQNNTDMAQKIFEALIDIGLIKKMPDSGYYLVMPIEA